MISKKLDEMSVSRGELFSNLKSLGKQFVKHFDKIYNENDEKTIKHHAQEMQNWLNDARDNKLKANKKFVSDTQIKDWFLTCAKEPEDLFDNVVEAKVYIEFIDLIKVHSYDVLSTLKDLGLYYGDE